jgi:hypothetical protein
VLVTLIDLSGSAAVVAELARALPGETGPDRVRVHLGDNLCVTMPVAVADALGDALAAVDDVVTW